MSAVKISLKTKTSNFSTTKLLKIILQQMKHGSV